MDAFVHASGDGFGNTAPLRSDTGAIDMDAISQVAHVTQGAGKLTRKEKKHAKREMKRRKKEAKKAEKEAKKTYSSIKSQLKDRDKELSDKMADARKKRDSAKDVVNYIGYNKMYQDGMQSMFAYPTVLNYFSRFSNEGRKFGLLLTGISQNATAMLANEAARNIVLNADFLMLLKQSPLDRMKWAELLNLSEQEEECIDESAEPGDGLLIAGNARVPIRGKFPSGNVLYDLFSTNPNETKKTGLGDKKDAKPVI